MTNKNWQYLIRKYLDNSIKKDELNSLLNQIREQKDYPDLKSILQDYWKKAGEIDSNENIDWAGKLDKMLAEARQQERTTGLSRKSRTNYRIWLAAASVFAAILVTAVLVFTKKPKLETAPQLVVNTKKDVAPPSANRTILTLANGKKIELDSAASGALAVQGSTNIEKLPNGQIVYKGKSNKEVEYNTLTVPRGSKIASVTLSDGTKVWLNSASSLTYPVAFVGNQRKVEITGEAYFEVAHNKAMPFVVKKDQTLVTVLGTHFNVNAYDDETAIRVTLLQGSVKVNANNQTSVLKPGQQAQIESGITIHNDVNIDEVMAWKNGEFQFGEAMDIKYIMRLISRWYDVDIDYKGDVAGHIGGTISRNENVSQVLTMLEMTGALKFEINDRRIVVIAKNF